MSKHQYKSQIEDLPMIGEPWKPVTGLERVVSQGWLNPGRVQKMKLERHRVPYHFDPL